MLSHSAARILGLLFSELHLYHFHFVFHRFPIGGLAKCSKVNNINLGIWTRTHMEVVNK